LSFCRNETISDTVKQEVSATMPHFGHVGVIEAARELAMQLDNLIEDEEVLDFAAATSTEGDNKLDKPKGKVICRGGDI
jgi:hypothetical protein